MNASIWCLIDIKIASILFIICSIIFTFINLFYQVHNLPPGPFPLPIIGNILVFRGIKKHSILRINEFRDKYGPVFTLWMGRKPYVFIYDLDIGKQLFHRNECSGRPKSFIGEILLSNNSNDIIFADYNESMITLRNVAIISARTVSKSKQFSNDLVKIVDNTVENIIKYQGSTPFSPEEHFYNMNLKTALLAAFGKIYSEDDQDFKIIRAFYHDFLHSIMFRMGLWEFCPIFRVLDKKLVNTFVCGVNELLIIIKRNLNEHKSQFNDNHIQDFCDKFIKAQKEAFNRSKASDNFLTDENIARTIFDLFIAGLETTHHTFKWIILLMTYYPKTQQKIRQEIEREIGYKIPEYEDRHRCHYVMAFISETLRFRNVNPLGLYHKTSIDIKLGNYQIPKDTGVFLSQFSIMNDEKYWPNPHQFTPERFLFKGKYIKTRSNSFIPFGTGNRICIGERLALTELFIMLVRFIQKTHDYNIELSTDSGLEPDSMQFFEFTPKYFEIAFKQKSSILTDLPESNYHDKL